MSERFVEFRLVDAFAETPFTGNSAGVVLDADGLTDRQMQLIAREVNAAETAFISGAENLRRPPRLRWFTPGIEVGFCGHATLGAAHAWALHRYSTDDQAAPNAAIDFETTTAGALRVQPEPVPLRKSVLWWLRMPDPGLKLDNTNPMKTCELLGMSIDALDPALPIYRTRDDDVIYFVKAWERLTTLRPNSAALKDWCAKHHIRGVFVSTLETLDQSVSTVSRFFAPNAGIDEDPVTGSAHGALVSILAKHERVSFKDGRANLTCLQGPPAGRTGVIRAVVENLGGSLQAYVGGVCHVTVVGKMRVPDPE